MKDLKIEDILNWIDKNISCGYNYNDNGNVTPVLKVKETIKNKNSCPGLANLIINAPNGTEEKLAEGLMMCTSCDEDFDCRNPKIAKTKLKIVNK